MFKLNLYAWMFDGDLMETLFYHYCDNAENRAREWLREYIDEILIEKYKDEPEDYGHKTWEEYIDYAINEGYEDEVFSIEEIELED